jgi:hypothetical protein
MDKKRSQKVQSSMPQGKSKPVRERQSRRATDRSIEEWQIRIHKKGVLPIVTLLAETLCYVAEDYYHFLSKVRQRAFVGLSRFEPSQWELFYRDPVAVGKFLWNECSAWTGVLDDLVTPLVIFARSWDEMRPEERMAMMLDLIRAPLGDIGEGACLRQLAQLREQFQRELRQPAIDNPDEYTILQTPQVQFLTTVWLPSMLLLGVSPAELFRRAEGGDLGAVCELLRLDPFAASLPTFVKLRAELVRGNQTGALESFHTAQVESLDLPRRAAFKIGIAAGVIGFSKQWCEIGGDQEACLNRTDLWNLFDLIAKERGRGNDLDDLVSHEAFQRAVSRHKLGLAIEGWDIFVR